MPNRIIMNFHGQVITTLVGVDTYAQALTQALANNLTLGDRNPVNELMLANLDLTGLVLANVDLYGSRLEAAVFDRGVFTNVSFARCIVTRTSFVGASFRSNCIANNLRFNSCDFTNADLRGLSLRDTRFETCNLTGARFASDHRASVYQCTGYVPPPIEWRIDEEYGLAV